MSQSFTVFAETKPLRRWHAESTSNARMSKTNVQFKRARVHEACDTFKCGPGDGHRVRRSHRKKSAMSCFHMGVPTSFGLSKEQSECFHSRSDKGSVAGPPEVQMSERKGETGTQ